MVASVCNFHQYTTELPSAQRVTPANTTEHYLDTLLNRAHEPILLALPTQQARTGAGAQLRENGPAIRAMRRFHRMPITEDILFDCVEIHNHRYHQTKRPTTV